MLNAARLSLGKSAKLKIVACNDNDATSDNAGQGQVHFSLPIAVHLRLCRLTPIGAAQLEIHCCCSRAHPAFAKGQKSISAATALIQSPKCKIKVK